MNITPDIAVHIALTFFNIGFIVGGLKMLRRSNQITLQVITQSEEESHHVQAPIAAALPQQPSAMALSHGQRDGHIQSK